MSRSKLSYAQKVEAVKAVIAGKASQHNVASQLGIDRATLRSWVRNYQSMGAAGLEETARKKQYSRELKEAAVQEYLSGQGSLNEVCKKYQVRSKTQLREWIKEYNGHKEFRKSSGDGRKIHMTRGRTTTFEERVEIVSFCLESGKDYTKTIKKYGVSYQQIYSWVRKYEEKGADGLVDKRGKRKDVSEMAEAEQLKAANRLLQAENERLKLEVAVLKKVRELEGRGY